MTQHIYEYPLDDFEPSKACMQHAITNGTCCPSGTHRHDCEIVQGYKKQMYSHAEVPMTFKEKACFAIALFATFTGIILVMS